MPLRCPSAAATNTMWGSSSSDLAAFEKMVAKNGPAITALVQKQIEPHIKEMHDRIGEIEAKMNSEFEFIEFLKTQVRTLEERNQSLEERNQALQDQLHQYLSRPESQ